MARNPLLIRKAAIEAVAERFEGKPFAWGRYDCARLAAGVLAELGYKPAISRFGRYSTAVMAYRRLKAEAFNDVDNWLDSIHGLQRTPFAFAVPGDILAMPGDGGRLGLAIHLGGDKILAFAAHEPHPCVVHARNMLPLICWSAEPCRSSSR